MPPHWRRPAGIVWFSANDMQMQLRHDVADGGEVYFCVAEMMLNELPHHRGFVYGGSSLRIGKIEQVRSLAFRHENKPGQHAILVEQDMAESEPSQPMTVGEQLGVNFKSRQGLGPRGGITSSRR